MKSYYDAIEEEAKDFVEEYKDQLIKIIKEEDYEDIEGIFDTIVQSLELYDMVHEWIDSAWYGFLRGQWCEDCKTELTSCAKVIQESNNVETDSGLWEGSEPTKAIEIQAFCTVCNDLYHELDEIIKELIEEELEKIEKEEKKKEEAV